MKQKTFCVLSAILVFVLTYSCSSNTPIDDDDDGSPPDIPTGVEVFGSDGAIRVEWNPVSDEDIKGYIVYWSDGDSQSDSLVEEPPITIKGLEYDVVYSIEVASIDKAGNVSQHSQPPQEAMPANTKSPAPPSETTISAQNISQPQIILTWRPNAEGDISHYEIYRSTSSLTLDDSEPYVDSLTVESFIDTSTIEIGVDYYYRVVAVDRAGWESDRLAKDILSDRALATPVLTAPGEAEHVTPTPTFSFNAIPGAKSYVLFVTRYQFGLDVWTVELGEEQTEITYPATGVEDLLPGMKYYWRVASKSKEEDSADLNSVSEVRTFIIQSEDETRLFKNGFVSAEDISFRANQ